MSVHYLLSMSMWIWGRGGFMLTLVGGLVHLVDELYNIFNFVVVSIS